MNTESLQETKFWELIGICQTYNPEMIFDPGANFSNVWNMYKNTIKQSNIQLYRYMKYLVAEISAEKFINFAYSRSINN